jgi:hypothetical protein
MFRGKRALPFGTYLQVKMLHGLKHTQTAIAQQLGISRNTVYEILNNHPRKHKRIRCYKCKKPIAKHPKCGWCEVLIHGEPCCNGGVFKR